MERTDGREYAREEKQDGRVRSINSGAMPEILLEEERVRVNGKHVDLGGALQSWIAALGSAPKCIAQKNGIALCVWEDLGIEVGTGVRDQNKAKFFNVYFQIPSPGGLEPVSTSSGREPPPARPRKAFPGYLQLDGFGIDAQTQFWEIRAKTKPERNLRCGLRDCSHPHGGYGDRASLYLRLNRSDDRGNVVVFSMDGGEEAALQARPPKGK